MDWNIGPGETVRPPGPFSEEGAAMKVEISYHDITRTEAIEARIRDEIETDIGRFADRVTRIEVHVGDMNSHKKGPDDKRCMMEARPAGSKPVVAEAVGEDLYAVISETGQKLEKVLEKHFAKSGVA